MSNVRSSLRQELVTLVRLALPITFVQVGMMLMGVVDTMMVGRVSETALAAVAVGNLVYLARELERPEYLDRAEQTLRACAPLLEHSPAAMPRMAVSLAAFLDARR